MVKNITQILVVDDSPTARQLIVDILTESPTIEIVGEARDGAEAVRLAHRLKPDVISMDINMPVMDGFQATREIMQTQPTPIVVVSASLEADELDIGFDAIQAGALAVLRKPQSPTHPDFPRERDELIDTLVTMADVAMVRRWNRPDPSRQQMDAPDVAAHTVDIVAIASSTGGPSALAHILTDIPADFPVPILITQHISQGFEHGLAQWLSTLCALEMVVPNNGHLIEPGQVIIAPSNGHMGISKAGQVILYPDRGQHVNVPCADVTMQSVAEVYGARSLGIVLTGMGSDGADGLFAIRQAGGATIAQDEDSCVVYGMPRAAAETGAARHILPLNAISRTIQIFVKGT